MNTDLVERLRKLSERQELKHDISTVLEAAAAIEALQAEVESMDESCKKQLVAMASHVAELQAAQPHWVSVEEPPKKEGRYWCATKFARHWIFYAAWYWNNVSDYIGVPVGEEEKADGFVFCEEVVYPNYWMPIEPPKEDEHGN